MSLAKLWMNERDVRHSVSLILRRQTTDPSDDSLVLAFDRFVASLTGGTFGDPDALADVEHVREISELGGQLRTGLYVLRDAQLASEMKQNPFQQFFYPFIWIGKWVTRGLRD